MSNRPLHLFIHPPYDTPPGLWTRMYGYGERQAEGAVHWHTALRTSGNGKLFAACSGKLSVRPPEGIGLPATEEMIIQPWVGDLPASVNLYLHLSPLVGAVDPLFTARAGLHGFIKGFAYLNIETKSLEALVPGPLDKSTLPRGGLTPEEKVRQLVQGFLDVEVIGGNVIGTASPIVSPLMAGVRQVGFVALTDIGPIDASLIYDFMRDFLFDGQPALDAFLKLAPSRWPVIAPGISTQEAIDFTNIYLCSMPVLDELRKRNLTAQQWRQVGNNQKRLWRNRLLRRVGHALAGSTAPPFEFDDVDWKNIFQLESIVEFYANFRDPWKERAGVPGGQDVRGENVPLNPGDAGYTSVDFCNAWGASATVSATSPGLIILDGSKDLSNVRPGHDTIQLYHSRVAGTYRISTVENAVVPKRVTVQGMPEVPTGPEIRTAWRINLRSIMVLLDSFGSRANLRGIGARVVAPNAPNQLRLDNLPNPSKINRNFDSIYLPSDTARATRRYVITRVTDDTGEDQPSASNIVHLDGNPVLDGGVSAWHIPAGLSGELPPLSYKLGPGHTRGYDHYDGVVFIIQNGIIYKPIRWTSYSSRDYAATAQDRSSVRGNRQYDFSTYRSGNAFRNYCIKVTDVGAAYDGVREARFYFSTPVIADNTASGFTPETDPAQGGKTVIRIHLGNHTMTDGGTGSAGCIVSPNFYEMRDELIRLYQIEFRALNRGMPNAEVNKVSHLPRPRTDSERLWSYTEDSTGPAARRLTAQNWNDKITGTLWVIRPDERALGP